MNAFLIFAVLPFVLIVLPMWIIFNFLGKLRTGRQLTADQEAEIRELYEVAARAEKRIEALETILDRESPNWKEPK